MKLIFLNISANLVALSCVGSAAYLAVHKIDGWGWFLFVAFCTTVAYKNTDKEDKSNEDSAQV